VNNRPFTDRASRGRTLTVQLLECINRETNQQVDAQKENTHDTERARDEVVNEKFHGDSHGRVWTDARIHPPSPV
jgi:hypothetical protein